MRYETPDEVTQSIRSARLHELSVSVSQRLVLDEILEKLEDYRALVVTEITGAWYKVNCLGVKVQLELHNPGGRLEIIPLPFDDESFSFPRRSWSSESVKLQLGDEDLIVQQIVSNFALLQSEN